MAISTAITGGDARLRTRHAHPGRRCRPCRRARRHALRRIESGVYSRLPSARLADRSLTYDANGNLTAITDTATAPGTDPRTMLYDTLDRLTKLTSTGYGTDQFSYDPLGNTRSETFNGSVTTYNYSAITNRISNQNGTTSWGYDDHGNVTQVGSFGFTYNRANEVTGDTLGTSFAYDARGWRVKKHVVAGGTHTRYFVYDAGHRLIERVDNGTATDFVYAGSKLVARRTGSTTTYVHGDERNSPLFETSSAGAITRAPIYGAYGRTNYDGIEEIPGYTGAVGDRETGIVYLGARYMAFTRFLSPDPAPLDPTTHIGLNRYAYANDNPVRFVDPDGRNATAAFGGLIVESWNYLHGDGFNGSQVWGALKDGYNGQGAGIASAAWQDASTLVPIPATKVAMGAKLLGRFGRAAVTKGRVFWSGSREARTAAEAFAKQSGGVTLEMTAVGKFLDKIMTKQTYSLVKPLWDRASTSFAKGAKGAVNVFQSSKGVRVNSVWATKEYPVLLQKERHKSTTT